MFDKFIIGNKSRSVFVHFSHLIHYTRFLMFYKLHVSIAPLVKCKVAFSVFNCFFRGINFQNKRNLTVAGLLDFLHRLFELFDLLYMGTHQLEVLQLGEQLEVFVTMSVFDFLFVVYADLSFSTNLDDDKNNMVARQN